LDFVSFEAKLVIEVDGGQHAKSETDRLRDEWLVLQGFKILRFWNNEVLDNVKGVLEVIRKEISPHLTSPISPC
jgi:very-short-patch-repair endonuclease